MRKFSAILIIISLLVSVFDIIDTSDITINGKAAFSSTNELNQDDIDNIDLEGFLSHTNLVFNLVEISTDITPKKTTKVFYSTTKKTIHEDLVLDFYEPPIA